MLRLNRSDNGHLEIRGIGESVGIRQAFVAAEYFKPAKGYRNMAHEVSPKASRVGVMAHAMASSKEGRFNEEDDED